MAMTVMNNGSAMSALGQLKKNDTSLSKDLKKVASGLKITGAADGASDYAIGKRMAVMLRSLDQDIENTKTGGNLVATAEGGIQEIISNLRDMKAMAINSANDHNTDADRAIIEKDFARRMETIDDIAATTNYNGKLLLNGLYRQPYDYTVVESTPNYAPEKLTLYPPDYTILDNNNGTYSYVQNNTVTGLVSAFSAGDTDTIPDPYPVFNSGELADYGFKSRVPMRQNFSVKIDFSKADLHGGKLPDALDKQGFTFGCAYCRQYINVTFDSNKSASESTVTRADRSENLRYVIGVKDVKDMKDLSKAMFEGIASTDYNTRRSTKNSYDEIEPESQTYALIDARHSLRMEMDDAGNFFFKKDGPPMEFLDRGVVVGVATTRPAETDKPITINNIMDCDIDGVRFTNVETLVHEIGTPLVIHTGTKSNQHLRVYINGMHSKDMGLEGVHVSTMEAAKNAMSCVDTSLEYALNEVTRMGAYRSRLEMTESNLVTSDENVQASQSTILDADMAKMMVAYTKDNVLAQSAQAMLAQANQNAGNVISLLQ